MARKSIEINRNIFPHVIQIGIGKPFPTETVNDGTLQEKAPFVPESMISLPADAYLMYLQKMVNDKNTVEMQLLEKYAYGIAFSDEEYDNIIKIVLSSPTRNTNGINSGDVLSPFGIKFDRDDDATAHFRLVTEAIPTIRAETWEYILIDHLHDAVDEIIECFDFNSVYVRQAEGIPNRDGLGFSLSAWKFSADEAEQRLSNALRSAFMFTLVGYCYGSQNANYNSFREYFDAELYKRVSLIYAIWYTMDQQEQISYLPLYDSFYNLHGISKNDLIETLIAIFDDQNLPSDEKRGLLDRLIEGADEYHQQIDPTNKALEDSLIKPALNFVMLREKAKDTLKAARALFDQGLYSDCANRCYYAIMYELKALLEHQGLLAEWKPLELKEAESHGSLELGMNTLLANNVLDYNDKARFESVKALRWKCDYSHYRFDRAGAQTCLNNAECFINKVETMVL